MKLEKNISNSHKKLIAEMLVRAFHNDPKPHYVFTGAVSIEASLTNFYEISLRYGLYHGEVHTTSINYEGIAIWLPSEKVKMSIWRMIQAGAILNTIKMGNKPGQRISRLSAFLDKQHNLHVPENHWYLFVLGVDPSHQGQGNASKLLKPMLVRLDEEGLPAYVQTNNEKNVPMYQHFGFEVVEESTLPGTSLVTWAMKRNSSHE